jgi:hypothetical protein
MFQHSHWAQQFIGLNFTNVLSQHLHWALQKVQSHDHHTWLQTTTYKKLYQPMGWMFQAPGYKTLACYVAPNTFCNLFGQTFLLPPIHSAHNAAVQFMELSTEKGRKGQGSPVL